MNTVLSVATVATTKANQLKMAKNFNKKLESNSD